MDFIEFTGKTVDDALTNALVEFGVTSDQIDYDVLEKGSSGFLGFNSKPAKIKARKKFLSQVFAAMGLEVEILINASAEEENVYDVELKGAEMGVLIGKRGQTLDSLQYLTNLAINKHSDTYTRVKLDTEDLAKNIAYKVKRTKKAVSLEPMNPFERRVIHSALQNDRYVSTHSEGDEPYRHVVITLKRQ